jgi:hypothetical protein
MAEKTFTVAGISTLNGEVSVRFANDTGRIKVLDKNGHTDILLGELPSPMTKLEAVKHMITLDIFAHAEEVLTEFIDKAEAKSAPKAPKAPKAKKVEVKPAEETQELSFEEAQAESAAMAEETAEDEEAPF